MILRITAKTSTPTLIMAMTETTILAYSMGFPNGRSSDIHYDRMACKKKGGFKTFSSKPI
jgi:hypothetical protein